MIFLKPKMISPKQSTQVRKAFFGGSLLSAGLGLIAVPLAGFYAMAADPITPVPDKIPCAVRDVQDFQIPDRVQLSASGMIGSRIAKNEANRLVKIDTDRLLEGYRKRPGRQTWDGEHIGKWLHAATLAWVNTGDPALREKLDSTVAELMKCQLEDGYLGTYLDKDRWTEWDVWAHKYNLIGLLTYMRYTGNLAPMPVCKKMADLLCNTFGDEPGKRDIIVSPNFHKGMAPGSVLEPMVLMYRLTGEQRYLDFAKYLLRAYEQPNGPKIVSTLLAGKGVNEVGNGKAYEMLSCLNGILEMYRTTGDDPKLLEACRNAWQDIVDKRLYLTGGASVCEVFRGDFELPNFARISETCVTTTWLQFNAQLLRLTGEAKYAEQLERVVLNQLFGAQKPDGSAWGYYVQMQGKKPYTCTLDGCCCLSSGPRGVALIPTFAESVDADGVVLNLYSPGTAKLTLRDGTPVMLTTETVYPSDSKIVITVDTESKEPFVLKARIPAWCRESAVKLNGKPVEAKVGSDGYAAIKRVWAKGDKVELNYKLEPRVIVGDHLNEGKIAVMYGPLVLAADEFLLGAEGLPISAVGIGNSELSALAIKPEPAPEGFSSWPHAQVFHMNAIHRQDTATAKTGSPMEIRLAPYADAGGLGAFGQPGTNNFKVWLPKGVGSGNNLLLGGVESCSRKGNVGGSINDDMETFVVTFDGSKPEEDWYAVKMSAPATIEQVVFMHGETLHDGGWFDTSAGKPKVQVQTKKGRAWETVGELSDYPKTTATDNGGLGEGNPKFTCKVEKPVQAIAVRVIGKPASGSNPQGAFSSCAELQAFGRKAAPGAAGEISNETDTNLLSGGVESRSRKGNAEGSIIDDNVASFVVTFEPTSAREPDDWYAVTMPKPATVSRIVFAHGKNFPDGGWFDTLAGKPRVQIQLTKDAPWETVGELSDYPKTTAADNGGLTPGQEFNCKLAKPVKAIGVRVIGQPASGINPLGAFSSCAELEAFAK